MPQLYSWLSTVVSPWSTKRARRDNELTEMLTDGSGHLCRIYICDDATETTSLRLRAPVTHVNPCPSLTPASLRQAKARVLSFNTATD